MRYHEFSSSISEDTVDDYTEQKHSTYVEKLRTFWAHWKKTRRECSDIVKVYKSPGSKSSLQRGFRARQEGIFKGRSVERMPEEGERREEVDAWLAEHGFEALRHDSIFVSNSKDQAITYARAPDESAGSLCLVLPCNGFKYTWYKGTDDLHHLNFTKSLGRADLTIEELMDMAQPSNVGIEEMLGTYRHHELHFTGSFWAYDIYDFGSLIFNELNGQGLQQKKRWSQIPADVAAYIGL